MQAIEPRARAEARAEFDAAIRGGARARTSNSPEEGAQPNGVLPARRRGIGRNRMPFGDNGRRRLARGRARDAGQVEPSRLGPDFFAALDAMIQQERERVDAQTRTEAQDYVGENGEEYVKIAH